MTKTRLPGRGCSWEMEPYVERVRPWVCSPTLQKLLIKVPSNQETFVTPLQLLVTLKQTTPNVPASNCHILCFLEGGLLLERGRG